MRIKRHISRLADHPFWVESCSADPLQQSGFLFEALSACQTYCTLSYMHNGEGRDLKWILYIDWKAFFSNRGHYQKDKQQHVQFLYFTMTVNLILILVLVTIVLLLFIIFPPVQVPQIRPPHPHLPLHLLSMVQLVRICQRCRQWHPCQKTPWRIWGQNSRHHAAFGHFISSVQFHPILFCPPVSSFCFLC